MNLVDKFRDTPMYNFDLRARENLADNRDEVRDFFSSRDEQFFYFEVTEKRRTLGVRLESVSKNSHYI